MHTYHVSGTVLSLSCIIIIESSEQPMGDLLLPTSEFYRLAKWSRQVSYASGVYDLQQTWFLFSRSSYNIWKTLQTKCD